MNILFFLIFYFILQVNSNEMNLLKTYQNLINTGPYYNSNFTQSHQFIWRQSHGLVEGRSFHQHLQATLGQYDFLYILTGDTQFWTPCTSENAACHKATNSCQWNRTPGSANECNQRHTEFANKLQQISMAALNRRFNDITPGHVTRILGLIINGDLTEFGHDDELGRFKNLWSNQLFDNVTRIYPGLGNHDIANNVGQCTMDHCVIRMLRWYRSYIKETLQLALDLRTSTKYLLSEDNIGSLAYSWDQCIPTLTRSQPTRCFHFIQFNNYPTYAKHIDAWLMSWKILPSLNWLMNDFQRLGANKSIVMNFHDFDTSFTPMDKFKFRNILDSAMVNVPGLRIVAIFFAHMHHMVGVKEWWCIGGRRVPLIYSGSVPGNNYVLAHFSPMNGFMRALYSIHVHDENISYVQIESIPEVQESCTMT